MPPRGTAAAAEMMDAVKRLARSAAARGGGFALARTLTARPARILMYHQFSGEPAFGRTSAQQFRQQLRYLRRHYRPVRLRDIGAALAADRSPAPRSVAITVDDGHASFVHFALPLLRELDMPATLFVLSELGNSGEWLWTDKVEYVRTRAARTRDDDASLAQLHRLPTDDRERGIADLARHLGVAIPPRPPAEYQLVSWRDLESLVQSGLVDVGAHTRTHRILSDLDAAASWDEIAGSRQRLEQRLDVEIATFCFPNGKPADYRADHLEMAARAGYSCAVAAHFGYVTDPAQRFALPRLGRVFGDMTTFRQDLDGATYLWGRGRREQPW